MSTHVGVYEAKSDLSKLIKRVAAGEIITITVNGQPVIDLVPTRVAENDATQWDWLEELWPADKQFISAVRNRPREKTEIRPSVARAFK